MVFIVTTKLRHPAGFQRRLPWPWAWYRTCPPVRLGQVVMALDEPG